jgi:hypothetical protein
VLKGHLKYNDLGLLKLMILLEMLSLFWAKADD